MKRIILTILLCIAAQSCSPKVIDHYLIERDTTYISHMQKDSVFFRDSIFIRERNDTVYQYVEKWRTKYVDRIDTVYHTVRDTTVVYQTVEVPRKAGWVDRAKNCIIVTLLLLAIVLLIAEKRK